MTTNAALVAILGEIKGCLQKTELFRGLRVTPMGRGKYAQRFCSFNFRLIELGTDEISYLKSGSKLPGIHPSRIMFSNLKTGNTDSAREHWRWWQFNSKINKLLLLTFARNFDPKVMRYLHFTPFTCQRCVSRSSIIAFPQRLHPLRIWAARTVLAISMAMVSGPTPPGTGVYAPASSNARGCTSPTIVEPRFRKAASRFALPAK